MAGRPRSYQRDDVLERAMKLFWSKGFEGTHLQELVEVTGLNRFSLYKEFEGKDGLFAEALARYIDDADRAYQRTLGQSPLGRSNIEAYFASIRFTADYAGCFMLNTLAEKHVVTERAFTLAKNMVLKVERMFAKNVRAAIDAGDIDSARDPAALAKALTALDQGMAMFAIATPKESARKAIVSQLGALLGAAP